MADQNADAKADSQVINQGGLGASSASDGPQHSRDSENIIQTVDVTDDGGKKGAEGADKGSDKGKEEGSDKQKGDEARYDKDPAWQRIMKERDDAREAQIRAEAKLEVLEKGKGEKDAGKDEGHTPIFTYDDITKMDDETIREKMEDNPKGFMVNLFSQIVDETVKVMESRAAQQTQKSTIDNTFKSFAEKHPGDADNGIKGFNDLWKSGSITKFMQTNPGHNAMSAYLEMTEEARINAATGKAAKEAAAKAADEARKGKAAKEHARVLGTGPSGAPADKGETLKDTKSQGGLINAITRNLVARRQQGQ